MSSTLPQPSPATSTAAGIVVFNPDPKLLLRLIDSVRPDTAVVYVFINALIDPDTLAILEALAGEPDTTARLRLIHADENLGVGEALNIMALQAVLDGMARLVLFDQDSRPERGMVRELGRAMDRLVGVGRSVAAVGPEIVAPAGEEAHYKSPRYWVRPGEPRPEGLSPVQFLITSGTLLDLQAFRAVGPFRADYFIDGIDLEWCLRAWSRGYSCWRDDRTAMQHTIGGGVTRTRTLGLATPAQSDARLYAYIRNTVYGWRLPHIPLWWKLSSAAYIALQGAAFLAQRPRDRAFAHLLARAARNGARGRLGPPDGAAAVGPVMLP